MSFPDTDTDTDSNHVIKDLIFHIQQCNHLIEHTSIDKQRSEERLAEMLCHTKHGAHTHEFQDYKITITTGSNYTLDKNKFADYLCGENKIDSRYNIVKPVTKYELNNKGIKDCDMYGSEQDRQLKDSFIKATPKKLHVKIQHCIPEIVNDVYNFRIDGLLNDDVTQ